MGLAPALTDLVATMWPEGRWKYAGAAAALGEVRGDTGGPDPVEPADGLCGTRWRLSGHFQQFTDTDGVLVEHDVDSPHATSPSDSASSGKPRACPFGWR